MRVLLPLRQQQQKKHGQSQAQQNPNGENSHSNNSGNNFGVEENSAVAAVTTTATGVNLVGSVSPLCQQHQKPSGVFVTAADTRLDGGPAISTASDIAAPAVADTNTKATKNCKNTPSVPGGDCKLSSSSSSAVSFLFAKQDEGSGYESKDLDGKETGEELQQEQNYLHQQGKQRPTVAGATAISVTESKKKSRQSASSSLSLSHLSFGVGVDHQQHQPSKLSTVASVATAKAKSSDELESEEVLETNTQQNLYLQTASLLSGEKSESNSSSTYSACTSSSLVGASATTGADSLKLSPSHNILSSTRKNTKERSKKRKSSPSLCSTDNSFSREVTARNAACSSPLASSSSRSSLDTRSNTLEKQPTLQPAPAATSSSAILNSASDATSRTDIQKHPENHFHNVSTTPTTTVATTSTIAITSTSSKRQKTANLEKINRSTKTFTQSNNTSSEARCKKKITSAAQSKLNNTTSTTLKKNSSSKRNNLKINKMPPLGPKQNSQGGDSIGGGIEEELVNAQFSNVTVHHYEDPISSNPAEEEEESGRRGGDSRGNNEDHSNNNITEDIIKIQDRRHHHHHHHRRHNPNPQQRQHKSSSASSNRTNASKYSINNKKSASLLSPHDHNSHDSNVVVPTMGEFEAALKKRGLELVEQDGDGNCLFRAVSFQVYGDANAHLDVRKRCMDFMAKDEEHFSQFVDGEPFRSYIRRKRQNGVHGNNPEIQAISELYNRPVEIFVPEHGAYPINIFHADYKTCDEPIRLSYHDGEHYNAVIDPFTPTAGLGLGLPGLEPGLADRMQVQKAVDESDKLHVQKMAEEAYQDEMQRVLMESKMEYITEGSLKQSSWNLNNSHHHHSHHRGSGDHRRRHQRSRSPNYNASYNGVESSSSNSHARLSNTNNNTSSSSSQVASIPAASASSASAAAGSYDEEIPAHLLHQDSDEYPQTVQELVMNGFDLQKVIKAYDLIGDNFDDLLAFLMSSGG